jgi:hypothetical protein
MDGARRTVAVGLTAMIAAALLLSGAPAADAITHARAKQIALRVLQPARQKGRVVVFTLRRRLGGREVVFPANPRSPRRVRFRRPGRARWFFWMDLLHDGMFGHRSVALTIDDRTGRVLSRQRWSWFPLVNGRRAPFMRTRRAYHSARWQIFNGISRRIRTRPLAQASVLTSYRPGGLNGPFGVPRSRFARDCLVTIGDRSAEFDGSYEAMESFAKDMGIRHTRSKSTFQGLREAVDKALSTGPPLCDDVFIYLAGHGTPPPGQPDGGPPGVATRIVRDAAGNVILNRSEIITPEELRSVLLSHPSTTFKLKIISCFSGRFLPLLERQPNLKVIETSSAADEESLFDVDGVEGVDDDGNEVVVVDPTDNPTEADEFTNGNVHGLYEWARMPDVGDGLAEGIAKSFDLGADEDFARTVGATHPQLRVIRPQPLGLYVDGAWRFFGGSMVEVQYQGQAVNRAGTLYRQSASPVTELVVEVPGGRTIVNQLCPSQLPVTQVSGSRLTCSGGSLPLNTQFTLNVRTSPNPSAGMGGQISARQDGQLKGPFPISGP